MTAADRVLLVSTVAHGQDSARAPRALANAGFAVTLLAPRKALAAASRFVDRVAYLPDPSTTRQWVHAFAATVRASSPALVMPCDDESFRLLAMLVVAPPPQLRPALQVELADLIRGSLGAPAHYRTSVDKSLLSSAAAAAGIPVPPHAAITTRAEAERFAEAHGYPVVIKRPEATARGLVRIVTRRDELRAALLAQAATDFADAEAGAPHRVMIQKHIDGHVRRQSVAAWQGRMVAGYAGDRLQDQRGSMAPVTVIRYHDDARLAQFSECLAGMFGISGLFFGEYLIERDTQKPYLLAIHRRIGPAAHYGAAMNVDLCKALHAAMHAAPATTRSALGPSEERIFVQFPGEWRRDPTSRWLRQYPVDVPWDDPELLDAMLASPSEP